MGNVKCECRHNLGSNRDKQKTNKQTNKHTHRHKLFNCHCFVFEKSRVIS